MYRNARAHGLRFYKSPSAVRSAVTAGRLVKLTSTDNVLIDEEATYPFARPETRTFVNRLGAQYRASCGEQMVVTSAVRPSSRQPANSSIRSVHPTGMAVDLRKPEGSCLKWLRRALLDYENRGAIEATEEHEPAHFHVAVFSTR